jgi:superfamily II DNA or RNA helicase
LFRGNEQNHVIVGSSNFYEERTISLNEETLELYREQFDIHNIQRPFSQAWSEHEEQEVMYGATTGSSMVVDPPEPYVIKQELTPRPAQILALQALQDSIKDDYDKALAVMATGLGKTYLAAFFAAQFGRVLFIAHREEILIQAQQSFKHVHPTKRTGFYNAKEKSTNADFVFASVQTLNQQHHLSGFAPDTFDLIVVDEFHHASAPSYMRILEYFKPEFLLGITATPYRLDNKDVFGLCDGNVAISIHFIDAIKQQWLAPFRYYGIYDDTDYSQLRWLGNRYDEEELAQVQLRTDMAEKILQEWIKHKQSRTIAFCSSIRQADFLNHHFQQAGLLSISLNGNTPNEERLAARERLNSGKLDIIFTVDLFNEGVDIPRVDTLLFVRPTESLAVFTQQIGRGLRIAEDKDDCVIIDLIGNYRNADVKWGIFNPTYDGVPEPRLIEQSLPHGCEFNIDTEVIDLILHMTKKLARGKELLILHDHELRRDLGHRPTYLEYHLQSGVDSSMVKREFGTYFNLLKASGDLNDKELQVLENYEDWFLEVERTGMTKSYKMVLLRCMLTLGEDEWFLPIQAVDAAKCFHHYLTDKSYRKHIDFSDKQGKEMEEYNERKVASLIHRMPMTMWGGSAKMVSYEDKMFKVNFDIAKEDQSIVYEWTRQICEYRLHTYFEKKSLKI